MPHLRDFVILAACVTALTPAALVRAADPLHVQIDQLIAAKTPGAAAEPADDAEFLRRIFLDLAGRIPTTDEARRFLADATADKRSQLIEHLANGPDYPRRMQDAWHVMLMERNGDHPEWRKFLLTAFQKNKPWDQIAREILAPNSEDEETRGAAFFYTKRLENYGQNVIDFPGLTRDVGRLFLGKDLQCAQCHDHLFVEDYKQQDFQGLFAFVGQTFIRTDAKFPAVGEKPLEKKLEFMSVFVKEKKETGPRLPGGLEVEVPAFAKGEEFAVAPDKAKNFPGTLKFSPLKVLGEQLPRFDHPDFSKNIVNRLWFLMLGRGLVHPLDLQHAKNPGSHPELLELLAREFAAHQGDVKWFVTELALTQTYQRSSRLPDGGQELPPESFLVYNEKPLSAEQLLWGMLEATGAWGHIHAAEPIPEGATAPPRSRGAIPEDLQQRFLKAFANPAREPEGEFSPSVKAALFVLNDSVVLGWLKPQPGNLADRLSQIAEPNKLAEELYLSVLTRPPTPDEMRETSEFLSTQAEQRPQAIGELIWALLASTEFAVNH
jgi:hypothetical protein